MVRGGLDPRGLQHVGGHLRLRARRRVDQRPTIAHQRGQQLLLLLLLLLLDLARHGTDARADVGPIEARHDDVRRAEAEELDDVLAHFRRGRGDQGNHRGTVTLDSRAKALAVIAHATSRSPIAHACAMGWKSR